MVHAYWLVGREIAEDELGGKDRADYGEQVVKRLAARLRERFGSGFSYPNVKRMRQIGSLLFERLAASKNKDAVEALGKEGQVVSTPRDVIKDPMVLEFLGLTEKAEWLERDLESAIIGHLQEFLLELGKGFCFVARQKGISLEGDHFYVDLVLYNRLLKAFVLVDLKMGKLAHQDLGQMQMYIHWFDRFQKGEDEAPTIGIILCSDKNDAMVRITLPEDDEQLIAARYQFYLPTEDELRRELMDERERVERQRRLLSDQPVPVA